MLKLVTDMNLYVDYKILDEEDRACALIANGLLFPFIPTANPSELNYIKPYSARVNPLVANNQLLSAVN